MRTATATTPGCKLGRRATMAVELLLVLPILLIFLVGMIEFSMILSVRFQLLAASEKGARVAAQGASADEVKTTVQRALGNGKVAAVSQIFVDPVPPDATNPADVRDRVQVRVVVNVGQVVPDLLAWAGIVFRNQNLTAATVMNME